MFQSPILLECRSTNKNERAQWDTLTRVKSRIIELMWAPDAQAGVQLAAGKFLQGVILVQSRGVADPRVSDNFFISGLNVLCMLKMVLKLQNKNDPNISNVPGDHPFINAAVLETEGVTLLQRLITDLYTNQYVGPVEFRVAT